MTRESQSVEAERANQEVDAGDSPSRYDFDRLERSIEFLLEEHQRLSAEHEALLEELVEREQRITSLQSQLAGERERRVSAVEGVDKIIGRLEQLQTSVANVMETA